MRKHELTIVTGASSNHFLCVKRLLPTVLKHEADAANMVVYDLGLASSEVADLAHNWPDTIYRKFDFDSYPQHFKMGQSGRFFAGSYAWKPVIVADIMDEFGGLVLWLDSSCVLTEPLTQVRSALKKDGLYVPTNPCRHTIAQLTHRGTMQYLNASARVCNTRQKDASTVGVDANNSWGRDIIYAWRDCAMDPDCIVPVGSSRRNHRQDQSVISILAYQLCECLQRPIESRRLQTRHLSDVRGPGNKARTVVRSGQREMPKKAGKAHSGPKPHGGSDRNWKRARLRKRGFRA